MKYLKQFAIIALLSFLGELLHYLLPLPVPASIYGLLLLFGGLFSGVIKLSWVKDTGKYLINIMPVMFIPPAVGLMVCWPLLRPHLLPYAVITVVSTIFVMFAAGHTTQALLRLERKGSKQA